MLLLLLLLLLLGTTLSSQALRVPVVWDGRRDWDRGRC